MGRLLQARVPRAAARIPALERRRQAPAHLSRAGRATRAVLCQRAACGCAPRRVSAAGHRAARGRLRGDAADLRARAAARQRAGRSRAGRRGAAADRERALQRGGAQLQALRARVHQRSAEQLVRLRGRLASAADAAPAGAGQRAMAWLREKRQAYQLVLQHRVTAY